jgi:DNA-binding transcriptional LysR family regulator
MSPVESRPLRHFAAVAEELSFARAAERLSISAPALSRTVAQLEAQLGVKLLERSTRSVALTAAGSVLLEESGPALAALDAAAARATRAAVADRPLVMAMKADLDGGLLEESIEAYARDHDGARVEVRFCGWGEQPLLLRSGEADVALMYQPHERLDEREIDFDVVLEEPQLAALAADHPLTTRAALAMADLEAEYQNRPGSTLWWPKGTGEPAVGDMSQLLRWVELDRLVALLPESVIGRFRRPQIAYRPVRDAPPARLAVAWPRASRSLATAAFVRVVADVAAGREANGQSQKSLTG